ncbi:hypothetical protein AHAS_Ahas11G0186700 [Arachis hypogaea]
MARMRDKLHVTSLKEIVLGDLRLKRPKFKLVLHGKDPRMLGGKGGSIILHLDTIFN